jgi:nucleoside-diphosphate-sugar epimerase
MLKRIGLTGNRGFIARHLSRHFVDQGFPILDLDDQIATFELAPNSILDSIDIIFHCAAKSNILESFEQPAEFMAHNIGALYGALNIALKSRATFVYFSSYVYGQPQYSPIDENHPTAILNPYMASKLHGEQICLDFCAMNDLDCVVLRPFALYGANMKPGRLVSDMLQCLKQGQPLRVNSPEPIRDHLHVKDLCELAVKIVKHDAPLPDSPIFNLGSGFHCRNIELAEWVQRLSSVDCSIEVAHQDRRNDVFEVIPDLQKIKSYYDWEPKINIERGLNLLLADVGLSKEMAG